MELKIVYVASEKAIFEQRELENGCACYVSGHGTLVYSIDTEDTSEYLAIENHSPFWCRPFWGSSFSELPQRTQALLIKRGDGYEYYLPVCDDTFKTLIRGSNGGFEFYTYSNCDAEAECKHQLAFIFVAGKEPLTLMRQAASYACELLDNGLRLRAEKHVPEVFDCLGWCSWDAMQIRVNHEGLVQKAEEFKKKGVPIRYAVIDDMWADVPNLNKISENTDFPSMVRLMHSSKLRSFSGDPERFPNGMKSAIDGVKQTGIQYVGVWFPTTGYWAGLEPDGVEAEIQKDSVIELKSGQVIVAPEKEKAENYFDTLCSRVKEWGGDFVKIDNQGFHDRYKNIAPIGKSARAIQRGIDKAADTYFDGAIINCMGMPSECMFNRTSTVCRCSDDFMPESREWFAKNILQCSYNGLLQGQFYVNDWDMWWTDDEQAVKNSLCRAISGGPIYISDKLERTRPDILKPLCLEDGRIIRPDESATPTADCLVSNPTRSDKIFKIRNVIGKNGVCAVFNINAENKPVRGTLSPQETGVDSGDYIWYEYFSGSFGLLKSGDSLRITLDCNDEFRLYTFVPYQENGDTCLGRTDLFMGIGAQRLHEASGGGTWGYVRVDENNELKLFKYSVGDNI